jgi:23S rRNA pseudouridine2605 synthase
VLERLQKILSARGIASRRKAEEYILQGLVKVNGVVATLGQKADPETDKIEVDGKVLQDRQEMLYYLLHKPVGILSSNVSRDKESPNPHRRPGAKVRREVAPERLFTTVRDILPAELQGKIFPVGRLDKDSGGLLLMTNDGVVAFRLTHPKFDHEKEYEVTVNNPISDDALQQMRTGMIILGERTKPASVKRVGALVFRIILTEGKNRQIRRMCEKLGYRVNSLRRVRIANLEDPTLQSGQIRRLTPKEIVALRAALGL